MITSSVLYMLHEHKILSRNLESIDNKYSKSWLHSYMAPKKVGPILIPWAGLLFSVSLCDGESLKLDSFPNCYFLAIILIYRLVDDF